MSLIMLAGVAVVMAGAAWLLISALFSGNSAMKRADQIVGSAERRRKEGRMLDTLVDRKKEGRRKQIEETLRQLEETEKERKRRITLGVRLRRAGLSIDERQFYTFSAAVGLFLAFMTYMLLVDVEPPMLRNLLAAGAGIVGFLGLPRWYISMLATKRQQKFLNDLPDAIDIMVRGLRSGLPVTDAMKVIATELPPPIGPEFIEVVEGQKIGITLEQGLERMHARMPLPEVNFLAIVVAIQRQTGGNLSETLANLSRVLRDRKKMKQKVRAVSQEAKASAAIIGSLPFVIMGVISFLSPGYFNPLWTTKTGNIMVTASAIWMLIGVLVMRKIINFKF